jgi:GcrA cell cycle regulator
MAWTKERIAKLQKMWEKGLPASQIAEELGEVTRNAVIGKAHRLNLSGRPSPVKTPEKKPKPKAKAKNEGKKEKERVVTLLMLTERICKWPIGHPGDQDFHFCGAKSAPGHPYCAEHASIAYQERSSKRDRRARSSAPRS